MEIFYYGATEIDYLKRQDKKLGIVIERIGAISCPIRSDIFAALVRGIVEQQLSSKAADSIWERLQQTLGEVTPQCICEKSEEELRSCGLSMRKSQYIKGVADAVINGTLKIDEFQHLSDEEIIAQLSSLYGVGVWTAEMILIFSMQRPDVLSWGDLAIRRGLMKLYGLDELNKKEFEKYRKRYSPYATVASLYLWAIANE